ncbi:MAG: glycosyltransferase family 2 protein [Verrucomicrobiaceae bacterium]|nr:MAG: glycosyltransferase family 2 protein [Verrucomicrobiaceae bacterium]
MLLAAGHLARCIAFIDDDASPAEGWLDRLLAPLERYPKVGVAAGHVLDGAGQRLLNRHMVADTLGRAFDLADAAGAEEKVRETGAHRAFHTAMGCNMAFRRSALAEAGGFDPFYQYFLEETDMVWRVLAAGYQFAAVPESRVLHRLGGNLARKPSIAVEPRAVVIRSQIHYIGKFGKFTFPAAEIEACIWERVLLDLEKIAWDSCFSGVEKTACGELQVRYLRTVAEEFRLDSNPDSSSLAGPSPTTHHASRDANRS